MKTIKRLSIAFFLLFIFSCSSNEEDYLNDAIDIIEENSINKYTTDWKTFRLDVLKKGRNAKSIKETYPAIRYALSRLADRHSRFKTAEEIKIANNPDRQIPNIETQLINNNIGYIKIPGFRGTEKVRAKIFAQQIQNKIEELDTNNIQYWIVDLGFDNGGYVWPMMLGLGPLLGDGISGYLVDADTNYFNWRIKDGELFHDKKQIMKLHNPYILKNRIKKLAVIISKHTASAGEAIAVSFKGSENSRFFGETTYGVSTGTTGYKLSDGAVIYVVRTKFADRNKNIYGVSVKPDVETSYWDAKETAIEWLNEK
ncbi:MAG: hypothetical protein C0595_08405 [Marinilabiliales bacterium]|nr:MAG: hypothetical protein C0595_08405 [Marinilabiliales bacterium]